MSRLLCNFDFQCLCVNNYRGEDYNKPDILVECEDCIFHPKNKHKLQNPNDSDKVIQSEQKAQYEKTLQTGIRLLKENPNNIMDILKISTRLSYLRGRIFEQDHLTKQTEQTESGEELSKDENCSASSTEAKTGDLKLARKCMDWKNITCKNKYCIVESCPLNKIWDSPKL